MHRRRAVNASVLACVLGLGSHARADVPTRKTTYFYGAVKYASPDGKRPFGETQSLVQRTVDPASRRIDEIVVQPGRKPGDKPSEFTTHLTRRGSTTVFDAVDEGHTFRGTLAFKGADWAWDAWTYDITLSDGGKLVGDGSLTPAGLGTHKSVLGKNGQPTVSVTETLSPITQQKYDELRTSLLGHSTALE